MTGSLISAVLALGFIAAAVTVVIRGIRRFRKKLRSGCDGGCAGCPSARRCDMKTGGQP